MIVSDGSSGNAGNRIVMTSGDETKVVYDTESYTCYFISTLILMEAVPADGYTFAGWSGLLDGEESPMYYTHLESGTITAQFKSGSGGGGSTPITEPGVSTEVSAEGAKNALDSYEDMIVLDISNKNDFEAGHILCSWNYFYEPYNEFGSGVGFGDGYDDLLEYRNNNILVYDQAGELSEGAAKALSREGFQKVFYMTGGLNAWGDKGFEISTDAECAICSCPPAKPMAYAGPDIVEADGFEEGDPITLFGAQSKDPNGGQNLKYYWTQISGPTVNLTGRTTKNPTFTAPDVPGSSATATVVFHLTVSYSNGDVEISDTDNVRVTFKNRTDPLAAEAVARDDIGEEKLFDWYTGDTVTLDGSGSLASVGTITYYQWDVVGSSYDPEDPDSLTFSEISTQLENNRAKITTFNISPDLFKEGKKWITFTLTVIDSAAQKDVDFVTISFVDKDPNNNPPVANAGPDQAVTVGENDVEIFLDGTRSWDPDDFKTTDDPTYDSEFNLNEFLCKWELFPGAEKVDLLGVIDTTFYKNAGLTNKFVAPNIETGQEKLEFQLTVEDSSGLKNDDTVMIYVNSPAYIIDHPDEPTAVAKIDSNAYEVDDFRSVSPGQILNLDGSLSTDTDGVVISHEWRVNRASDEDTETNILWESTEGQSKYTVPLESGSADITLTVVDDTGKTDDVSVTLSWENLVPVAVAGSDRSVDEGAIVELDGSASFDPDDGIIKSWHWITSNETEAQIKNWKSNTNNPVATFTAPRNSGIDPVKLIFKLIVKDSVNNESEPVSVAIDVNHINTPPIARVWIKGEPSGVSAVDVDEFSPVTLVGGKGRSTDSEGGITAYEWRQTSGTDVDFDRTAPEISFNAPLVDADSNEVLTFTLTVKDEEGLTDTSDPITVSINNVGEAPTVSINGADQRIVEGSEVTLAGTGSTDPDLGEEIKTWHWTQVDATGTTVQMNGENTSEMTFTAPAIDSEGGKMTLTFELAVTDDHGLPGYATDDVVVYDSRKPVADPGGNQDVKERKLVILDPTGSNDPDGGPLTYEWSQRSGTTVALETDSQTGITTFKAPKIKEDSELLLFALTVTDHSGDTDTDFAYITVKNDSGSGGGCFISETIRFFN